MSERGKESQQDRFCRIKEQGIEVFDNEMREHNLSEELIQKLHKHCDKYYGCCAIQEQMMEILMDCINFTDIEADWARKIVAKKQITKIPELKEKVYENLADARVADYLWEIAIAPQLGYAFSLNHSLPYSFVGMQTIYLATHWNSIYWNTACLVVNSGSVEGGQTDYKKIAKAVNDIRNSGINVSLTDINNSSFGFKPDVNNNKILFGLKGLPMVNDDLINDIISKRPYQSMYDFYNRVNPKKQAMLSLIKSGAFDNFNSRYRNMVEYIWLICDKKKRLTLQNLPGLIKYQILKEDTEEKVEARRIYEFNRYLKSVCKYDKEYYKLDERSINFLNEMGYDDLIIYNLTDNFMNIKAWDKIYQSWMDIFRNWISADKDNLLNELNNKIFLEEWNKYAKGNLSSWEMESLSFYYHDHELKNVNKYKYGLSIFSSLPTEPVIEKTFKKNEALIPIYKLDKIYGTCIAKDKNKAIVYLLTVDGTVVPINFRKEYFSMFDKQTSQKQLDGTKKILEKSWFNKGNMILVQGIRQGDNFIPKKYSSSPSHQLYHIDEIKPNGDIVLRHERYTGDLEEEDSNE